MKQITECLDRVFNNQRQLKKKWIPFIIWHEEDQRNYLFLYHYHHLVLVYDLRDHDILLEWHEKPADKRGLDSAKKYLEEKFHGKKH